MVLEQRPDLAEIVGIHIVDPEDRVRIAHVHHRRRMQDRLVDRTDLQFDRARVLEFFGQRNSFQSKRGTPMSTVEISGASPFQQLIRPALVWKVQRLLSGLLEQDVGHAAHAVAAGAGLGAIVVVDADKGVGALQARRMQSAMS